MYPFINANLTQKEKNYDAEKKMEAFDIREGYVQFLNGELICGRIGKSTLGGSKSGLLYFIIKKAGH